MQPSVYERPEHAELRNTIARFLAEEVEPHGEAWEEQGFTPREVIRKLGSLGLLGITYPPEYGGAGADNVTAVVFQEALSRSTFGGFVITVLVHTDMASPASRARRHRRRSSRSICAEVIARRAHDRGRGHRARRGLRRRRHPHARAARR